MIHHRIDELSFFFLPLGSSSVLTDNDTVLPIVNVLLDPLANGGLGIQVVDREVEESLHLRGVQIHGNDMVDSRDREDVSHHYRQLKMVKVVSQGHLGECEVAFDNRQGVSR